MAIRNSDGTFVPGVIYCLISGDLENEFDVFYVGESADWERRYLEHKAAGRNANADSTEVYRHINLLELNNIPWSLQIVQHYGEEGPEEAEDEVLIKFTLEGCNLTNEKHGNRHWCRVLEEMSYLGFTSYDAWKDYKKKEKDLKESKKIKISTLVEPLSKADIALSKEKRRIAKERGLIGKKKKK